MLLKNTHLKFSHMAGHVCRIQKTSSQDRYLFAQALTSIAQTIPLQSIRRIRKCHIFFISYCKLHQLTQCDVMWCDFELSSKTFECQMRLTNALVKLAVRILSWKKIIYPNVIWSVVNKPRYFLLSATSRKGMGHYAFKLDGSRS